MRTHRLTALAWEEGFYQRGSPTGRLTNQQPAWQHIRPDGYVRSAGVRALFDAHRPKVTIMTDFSELEARLMAELDERARR